ncbi:hypothetical protein [Arthrobacter sp. NA-172]|uniref:hypothetical protein n=1 Tax=Arthrobacter sp. NA-172 TaxID=3367524 RepID=UPI003754ABFB
MADGAIRITALYPVEGISVLDGRWEYAPLGISVPAPPQFLTLGSSPEAFTRAHEALDSGLASARHAARRGPLALLRCPRPVLATESVAVPPGSARSLAQAMAMMLRTLGWPLVLIAAVWCALEAAGQRTFALLGSLAFLILVSLILHELGHLAVFRFLAPSAPALFSVRSGRFRLVRCSLPRYQDVAVTVAGPAAPWVLPLLLSPFYSGLPVLFWTSAVVAGSHLVLLLRNDGDGGMLRAALGQRPPEG